MPEKKKKNAAAVSLARARWKDVPEEVRSQHASDMAQSRWTNTTEEERAAIGEKLAAARAAARKKPTKTTAKKAKQK